MQKYKSIIETLYYGNIAPFEKYFERSSEFAGYMKEISESEEKLLAALNEEERQVLTQLIEAESRLSCFSELEHFVEGFRLGAMFMLDTFVIPRKNAASDIG